MFLTAQKKKSAATKAPPSAYVSYIQWLQYFEPGSYWHFSSRVSPADFFFIFWAAKSIFDRVNVQKFCIEMLGSIKAGIPLQNRLDTATTVSTEFFQPELFWLLSVRLSLVAADFFFEQQETKICIKYKKLTHSQLCVL